MKNRVVITGMGGVSSIGMSVPEIYNSLREHSKFEKRIIRETKRRVQELIGGQNGLTDPDSISRIVATECMNNLSNRRAI